MVNKKKKWFVYMIRCEDNSLYTGITIDVERRFSEHTNSKLGAKYTKAKKPKNVVYKEEYSSRSSAQKREAELKKFKKNEKEKLVSSFS